MRVCISVCSSAFRRCCTAERRNHKLKCVNHFLGKMKDAQKGLQFSQNGQCLFILTEWRFLT